MAEGEDFAAEAALAAAELATSDEEDDVVSESALSSALPSPCKNSTCVNEEKHTDTER